jgi:thiol-disulfide isomerase/thioredoxin
MDLLVRLVIVALLVGVGAVINARYRRRSADDVAVGAVDLAGARLWPDLPAELRGPAADAGPSNEPAARRRPTWIIFTTPLCVSCSAVQADLERHFAHHDVRKVDATERPDLADLYGVRRAPTTVLADTTGRIVERLVGPEAVREFIGSVDDAALHT